MWIKETSILNDHAVHLSDLAVEWGQPQAFCWVICKLSSDSFIHFGSTYIQV